MRRAIHQKTISFGGKQSGKIEGGMYFVNNPQTSAITDLSSGTFVSIGNNAGITQIPFEMENRNEYFEIFQTENNPINPQTTTQFQELRYLKGRDATILTLDWGVSIIDSGEDPPPNGFKVQFRVSKRNTAGILTTIDQTLITAGVYANAHSRVMHSTIVSNVNVLDSFFIEIANELTGRSVSVTSAFISLTE